MLGQATWSGGDQLDQVVEAHAQFLCNGYSSHYRKFQDLLRSDREAAKAEAAIFALLKQLRLNPKPNDAPGIGGPDFICHPDGREPFVVEVTSISEEAVERQSSLPKDIQEDIEDQSGGTFKMMTSPLRTKISNKAKQMSNCPFARVLAVGTTQHAAASVLGRRGAEYLLTSDQRISYPLGSPRAPVTLTTDLHDSIFFRRDQSGQIVPCRTSISAILLVCIYDYQIFIVGILHPEPTNSFDIRNLVEVPFLRVRWPIVDGNIEKEWVVENPRVKVFWHKAVQCNQTAPAGQEVQELETSLAEVGRLWQERTLAELASEQGVGPIHQLEEVLGRGESLWRDAVEFESFVQDIYQRRKEDRERGE